MFPVSEDKTEYIQISDSYVNKSVMDGVEILKIDPEALTLLTQRAFKDVSHLLRKSHLKQLKDILDDKTIEFTLTFTKHHPDAEDNKEYAFVKNYKLDEVNDMGRKVPQKYIKEFNSNI